jgi:hypothetical protein
LSSDAQSDASAGNEVEFRGDTIRTGRLAVPVLQMRANHAVGEGQRSFYMEYGDSFIRSFVYSFVLLFIL